MDTAKKIAVITGGRSGLRAATAEYLASQGAIPVLFDLNLKAIQSLAKSINGLAVECNVCDEKSVENAIQQVIHQFSAVHIAVNCAGIAPAARIVSREGPLAL